MNNKKLSENVNLNDPLSSGLTIEVGLISKKNDFIKSVVIHDSWKMINEK